MNNPREKDMQETTNFFYEELVTKKYNATIPEPIFKNSFLPFFSGQDTTDNTVLSTWVGIAGTAMNEVDVIDDITGNVLFTVPPILDTGIIKIDPINNNSSSSLSEIISDYEIRSSAMAIVGERFLADALDSKFNVSVEPKINTHNADRWKSIMEYYGIQNTVTKTTNVVTNSEDNDDVVY